MQHGKQNKRKVRSGAQRMQDLGKKPSQLWFDPADLDLIREAAALERRPVTNFIMCAALKAARAVTLRKRE